MKSGSCRSGRGAWSLGGREGWKQGVMAVVRMSRSEKKRKQKVTEKKKRGEKCKEREL